MLNNQIDLPTPARHRSGRAFFLATVFCIALPCARPAPAMAAKLQGMFAGGANSISISGVSPALSLALHTAATVGCPCRGTGGNVQEKSASSINVPGLLSVQATVASAYGAKTHDTAETSQSATITALNLFGGVITADALVSVATVNATAKQLTKSDEGTVFTNLTVNGTPIDPAVPDNTVIALPGLGSLTIKEVTAGRNAAKAHEDVAMLVVDITKSNNLGLPVGAKLVIGRAKAEYDREQPLVVLSGGATGLDANAAAGALLREAAGSAAAVGIPGCSGTNGQTLTNSVSNLSVPGLLSIATIETTALGAEGKTSVAATSSTASDVSLIDGLVTASSIAAVAQESNQGGVDTPSAAGSGFVGLAIGGIPVDPNLPPNTSLSLPGIGTVIVNEQLLGAKSAVQVNGLHIKVTQQNLLGLAVGAQMVIAHANATAKKF